MSAPAREVLERVVACIRSMEEAQRVKVVELARRLRPGLTPEDVRNPHDFPDLEDPDWHFEDGQLAGIESVRFAIARLSRELLGDGGEVLDTAEEEADGGR